MHNDQTNGGSFRSRHSIGIGSIVASIVFAGGAVGSWFGLVHAREKGNYGVLLWLGFLVLALAVGSMLSLAVPLIRRIEDRAGQRGGHSTTPPPPDGDYVARYSAQDQIITIILSILFGALTLFVCFRSHGTPLQIAFITIFCGLIAYAVQVTSTSIRFTNERITARLPWFRSFSEPYAAIERLQSKPGTIRIQFSDGRSLSLHSGLGDPDLVISYLQTHCPESAELEGWPRSRG